MTQWIDVAALEDIPVRGARVVKTKLGCVGLFRTAADEVFALENSCPHKKGPLSEGIVHGSSVTCPLHNWVISLETGMVQGLDEGQVATYATKLDGGRILLDATILTVQVAAE